MKNTKMIKKKGTFKYLFNNGKLIRGKYVSLYQNLNKNANLNTFGVCVSKKNGNSVSRNKIKRWVREVYKNNENKIKKGINFIIVIKKDINYENTNYFLLKEDIESIFEQGKLYEDC